jgi:uncharacterized protein YukE
MSITQVEPVVRQLKTQADDLDAIKRRVESLVAQAMKTWGGADASRFRSQWETSSRRQMTSCGAALREFATRLAGEIEQQRQTSQALAALAPSSPIGPTPSPVAPKLDSGTGRVTLPTEQTKPMSPYPKEVSWATAEVTENGVVVRFKANPGQERSGWVKVTYPGFGSEHDSVTEWIWVTQSGGRQDYVALGDSYSAGPGALVGGDFDESVPTKKKFKSVGRGTLVEVEEPDGEAGGWRAAQAWPRQLGEGHETGSGTPQLDMGKNDFAAETGAKTEDVLRQIKDNAEALRAADIVTVSVGGNDIDFAGIVQEAIFSHESGDYQDWSGRPLDVPYKDGELEAFARGRDLIKNDLNDKLVEVYTKLLEAAPDATIYVTGYPYVVEADDVGQSLLGVSHVAEAEGLVRALNQAQEKAIAQAVANNPDWRARIEFVDPNADGSPFAGHSYQDADPYYTKVLEAVGNKLSPTPYAYHPNLAGNEAYADVVGQKMLGQ